MAVSIFRAALHQQGPRSANAVRSDFADAVADVSAAAVECKECKYASKSDAADSDAASLPLELVSALELALSLEVL